MLAASQCHPTWLQHGRVVVTTHVYVNRRNENAMHTRTTGVVAAMISLGAGLIFTPAASATTEIESTTAPTIVAEDTSGVVIARDETFRLRAVPSVSRAITVTNQTWCTHDN